MSEENKASQPLMAGSAAPDFSLPARSGKTISLHDFAGQKNVLIYFYPKDDTPGCTRESCSLRDGWAELTKAGIEVLGVSRDDAASHNAFAAKYNLPFELLTDADHAVHEKYGAWGQNPNPAWGVGPLRKSFLVGKDGKVRVVFDRVDTEHHAEQVLRAAGFAPMAKPLAPPAPKPAAPPAPPAPPAPRPPAPAVPAAAAPAPRPPAPPAPKPAVSAAPKAAAPVKQAAPKKEAAPKKKAAKKAVKKVKKAVKKVKKAVRKRAAKRVAKRAARRSARKAVRTVRKVARKVKRAVRRPKRAAPKRKARKTAKRKKR